MTDADAFLARIIAEPDKDAPRLVYADWLDDRGESDRAEFIRVQCRLAKVDENNRDIHPLAARERELLEKHQEQWLRPLRDIVYPDVQGWLGRWRTRPVFAAVFRRGFPEAVVLPCARFLQYGADLCRAAPVQEVQLDCFQETNMAGWLDALTQCPQLDRLTTVRLRRAALHPGELQRLLHSAHLGRLRELYIDAVGLTDDDLKGLTESPLLERLRRLKLDGCGNVNIGVTALTKLIESPACRGLVALGLCGGMIASDEHLRTVVASAPLENLTDLDLSENLLRQQLPAALPQVRPGLRRLVLRGT